MDQKCFMGGWFQGTSRKNPVAKVEVVPARGWKTFRIDLETNI